MRTTMAIAAMMMTASALSGAARAAPSPAAACLAEKVLELPVKMSERRPLVTARINGVDQLFMADSGAVFSMIPAASVARLKLSPQPTPEGFALSGLGGNFEVKLATARSFEIGGHLVPDVGFLIGGDANGVGLLGQNVLGFTDVQYDLPAGMIRLVKANPCGERGAAAWAAGKPFSVMEIEPMEGNQRHIAGMGSINGVSVRAVFDTGSPSSLLSLVAAQRAGIRPGDPGVIPAGTTNGLGGAIGQSWISPGISYRLGGRDIRGDTLRIADMGKVPFDLLIGVDFFLTHRVYIAASQNRLYFTQAIGDNVGSLPALADAAAYSQRGNAFAAKGDWPNAIADFTRAIEMAPNEPHYLVQRASSRVDNKQALLARHDLDQAVRMKPDLLEARMARAMLGVVERNFPLAREDLAVASRLLPREADQRLLVGGLYAAMEDWQPSREQFDTWLQTHPGEPRSPVALNASCWAGGMLDAELGRALAACDAALRPAPDNLDFRDSRALVLLRLGRWDEAIADYDRVLAKRSDSAWSFFGRGLARIRKGQSAEGRADIAAAIALSSDLPDKAVQIGLIRSPAELR